MAISILMPALSPTMTSGNLVKWTKKIGDKVKPGEVIAEVETDKATMEVESVDEGILARIAVEGGTKAVSVNTVIGVLKEDGDSEEDLDALLVQNVTPVAAQVQEPPKAVAVEVKQPVEDKPARNRTLSSPISRRLAAEHGIDLANIAGSGPDGRVIKRDVLSLIDSRSQPRTQVKRVAHEAVPMSAMRSAIAKRLVEAKQAIPHFYLTTEVNVSNLLSLREEINKHLSGSNDKLTVNDMIVMAVAHALAVSPEVNVTFASDGLMHKHTNVDIAIAVSIDGGLITPIVQNADQKGILAISREIKALVARARSAALKPHEFQGGTIGISNLGMYGIKSFSAIINPPQSIALAIGGVFDQRMTITASYDHRVIDGAPAAQFLSRVKENIESPSWMIFKGQMGHE